MTHAHYWREVVVSLRRIIRSTDLQSKRMVKECGLTIPQVMVLSAINDLGDVTVKRISDHVSLSQATVTVILNRLEEQKFLKRVRSKADKRVVNAQLTASGRKVLASAPSLLHEKFIEQFALLPDWEKTQMLAMLQRLAAMMDVNNEENGSLLDLGLTHTLTVLPPSPE